MHDEVADQTLAFMLATTRQLVTHANHLRAGKWDRRRRWRE
jgi:lactate dehydrogenase-like 2-hydroxyacid dehydrogenase